MLRIQGSKIRAGTVRRFGASGLALTLAAGLAGCATDIRRLEQPSYSLTEGKGAPRPQAGLTGNRANAGAPIDRGESWTNSGPRGPLAPPVLADSPRGPEPTRMAALPPAANRAPVGPSVGPSVPIDKPKSAQPAAPAKAVAASGETIEVQPGDSLYVIAKRHNVAVSALMEANGLTKADLKPGQKLSLPQGAKRPRVKDQTVALAPPAGVTTAPAPVVATPATPAQAVAASDWTGSYTVKAGDSLYAVARAHKAKLADLQSVNGIADATKVKPGAILKVPANAAQGAAPVVAAAPAAPVVAPVAAAPSTPPAPRVVQAQPIVPVEGTGAPNSPKIINTVPVTPKTEQVAARSDTATDAGPQVAPVTPTTSTGAKGKFQWPAKGELIAKFGKQSDQTQSDGIKIGVPAGTAIQAADGGTVAYAGNELKGYGNLVLLRHDNGWVSAYAHADEILVKRGDTVKRGQTIAKAGQTGTVDKPQIHFELRQGAKPVDPLPHLDK